MESECDLEWVQYYLVTKSCGMDIVHSNTTTQAILRINRHGNCDESCLFVNVSTTLN